LSHDLVRALANPDPATRAAAARRCAEAPSPADWIGPLIQTLGDAEKSVGLAASAALVSLSQRSGDVAGALQAALLADDEATRWGAAFTAAQIGPPHPELWPVVVEAMGARDGDRRWAAAALAGQLASQSPAGLERLLLLVAEEHPAALRRTAIFCLRDLSPPEPRAAQCLVAATNAADRSVRRAALAALGRYTAAADRTWPRLLAVLREDPDAASRRIAALSLGSAAATASDERRRVAAAALRDLRDHASHPDLRRAAELGLRRMDARG
jgi:HEAT repeat protein